MSLSVAGHPDHRLRRVEALDRESWGGDQRRGRREGGRRVKSE